MFLTSHDQNEQENWRYAKRTYYCCYFGLNQKSLAQKLTEKMHFS